MYFIQTYQWKKKLIVSSYLLFQLYFFSCAIFLSLNCLTVSFKLYDMDGTGFIERKEVIAGLFLDLCLCAFFLNVNFYMRTYSHKQDIWLCAINKLVV